MRVIHFSRSTGKSTMLNPNDLLDQYTECLTQLFRIESEARLRSRQLEKQVPAFQAMLFHQLDTLWVRLMEPTTYTLLPEESCA